MVDASSFNLQPNFPIANIADLYAQRPFKEAQMRSQQQKQLVEGLQSFGTGVDSLVNQRLKMAQALASAHLFAGTPSGQQALGTNQVTSAGQTPVAYNQTANYNPSSGSVTPNQGSASMNDLSTALMGAEPKDILANLTAQKQLSYEPQKLAIEGRKAAAEEENNKIQRLIQGLLASNTIKNQAQERKQAEENAALEANKETAKHYILHPFAAAKAAKSIQQAGQSGDASLPEVGKTIVHSSGVKITRTK